MDFLPKVRTEDGIVFIEINNPPLNIIDNGVITAILSILDEVESDPSCRALVLSGAGEKGFSAGASVEEHRPEQAPDMIKQMVRLFERLHNTPLVTLAAIHGVCFGGGAELALACDFIVASEDVKFSIPEITLGCYPPFAMLQLPTQIGNRRAKEMILSGKGINAEIMSSFGLANLIVPRNELIEAATGFLQKILINPPDIVSLTLKRMRMLESSNSFSDNQQMGQLFLEDLMSHPDYIEGITSFLDKRKPAWGNMRMKEKR